jgi:c-di-GMP-binding flagellar brake protein YcgR
VYRIEILFLTIIILILLLRLVVIFAPRIKFYLIGMDFGFKIHEINLLWRLSKTSDIKEPTALYWSITALDHCIAAVINESRMNATEHDPQTQHFLEKLYKYRTKVELDPTNSKSMRTTKSLVQGQRLRIILPGHGVFSSKVLNVGRELVISMPLQKKQIVVPGKDWIDKKVNVYLFRHNDAGYVFDTYVKNIVQFNSENALYLEHTENLLRVQKRHSVRTDTAIYGQLYIENSETMNHTKPETLSGLKCLIEDISEDGALIRIGGKGKTGLKLKLQYLIDEQVVVMYGIIKGIEYNTKLNQSRMHFECIEIDPSMKNLILTFVYKLLPENEKNIYDAIRLSTKDDKEENPEELETAQPIDTNDTEMEEKSDDEDSTFI